MAVCREPADRGIAPITKPQKTVPRLMWGQPPRLPALSGVEGASEQSEHLLYTSRHPLLECNHVLSARVRIPTLSNAEVKLCKSCGLTDAPRELACKLLRDV